MLPPAPLAGLAATAAQARAYAEQAKADNAKRAYRSDRRDFTAWCDGHQLVSLPTAPAPVVLCMTDLEMPTRSAEVRAVMQGIRRAKGTAQRQKTAAITIIMRAMVAGLPGGVIGLRDRALLLLGFAGAFRRSELVSLDVGNLAFTADGLVVTLRRAKTDQEGQGATKGIPFGSHYTARSLCGGAGGEVRSRGGRTRTPTSLLATPCALAWPLPQRQLA
jgi:integrase